MADRSSIFDMIGPVMIGPSSSHTAGVVRIGRVARRVLGETPDSVEVTFYNSFARTYEGHGSDRAIIAGILDYKTDDDRIKGALEDAKGLGIELKFKSIPSANALHPNTLRVKLGKGNRSSSLMGISRGGGIISIVELDGLKCNFSAQTKTLVIDAGDVKGSIAFLSNIIAHDDCNIAAMSVARDIRNGNAKLVIEMDSGLRPLTLDFMRNVPWVKNVTYIPDIDL